MTLTLQDIVYNTYGGSVHDTLRSDVAVATCRHLTIPTVLNTFTFNVCIAMTEKSYKTSRFVRNNLGAICFENFLFNLSMTIRTHPSWKGYGTRHTPSPSFLDRMTNRRL